MAKKRKIKDRNKIDRNKNVQQPCFIKVIEEIWRRHGVLKDDLVRELQNDSSCLITLFQMIDEGIIDEYYDPVHEEMRLILGRKGLFVFDGMCKEIQKLEGLESSRFVNLMNHFYRPMGGGSSNPKRPEFLLQEKRFDILYAVEHALMAVRIAESFYGPDSECKELDVTPDELPSLYYQIMRTLKVRDDQLVYQHGVLEKQNLLERNMTPRMVFYSVIIPNSMTYVRIMSIIEFIFKQHLLQRNDLKENTKRFIDDVKNGSPRTFGVLIDALDRDGYLDKEIISMLRDANMVRNFEVHNNAVAQKTRSLVFGDFQIECEKGQELDLTEIDHMIIIMHIKKVIDAFYQTFVKPYAE